MARKKRPIPPKKPKSGAHRRRALEKFAAHSHAAAAKHCRLALSVETQADDLWHLLAASLYALNDLQGAQSAIAKCRTLAPNVAHYRNTEGLIEQHAGRSEAAELAWREILERAPDHSDANYNLGRLLARQGRFTAAVQHFLQALSTRPDWPDALENLAHSLFELKDVAAAEVAFARVLSLSPERADTLANLGNLAAHQDQFASAADFYQRSLALQDDAATLLRLALLCPTFSDNAEDITAHRARIKHNLELIRAESLELLDPVKSLGAPSFNLAYQGHNDREIAEDLGAIIDSSWSPPKLPARPRRHSRPRVAIVSAHFKYHAIGRLYAPLLEQFPRDEFELAVMSVGHHEDDIAARISRAANLSVKVDVDFDRAHRALHELDAEVVFFPDVGMEAVTYWLAATRNAPVQCLGWGHPVTSGLATLDYFISSDLLEPPDAGQHYSESLHCLPSWPVVYDDPGRPNSATFRRQDFGLKDDRPLYLCPQSLFKIHPDFDHYLDAILKLDGDAQLVLVGSNKAWRERLQQRHQAILGKRAERIHYLPGVSTDAFYALLNDADVVLDTIHFSGGITSFETIFAATPFVTERSALMRGRVTAGLCDVLGIEGPLANGPLDYATRATAYAHQGDARDALIEQLQSRRGRLLDLGPEVGLAYRDFFTQAVEASANGATQRLAS